MGILLGLTAALCWGSADFLAQRATKQIGTIRTLFFLQCTGATLIFVLLAATGQLGIVTHPGHWQDWGWAIVAAILNVLSSIALYRALQIGIVSIVSPITATYAAVIVIIAFLTGERLSHMREVGIILTLAGVVLTAFHRSQQHTTVSPRHARTGIMLAIIASIGYGICFWLLAVRVTPTLGTLLPVLTVRVVSALALIGIAVPAGQALQLPPRATLWTVIALGLIDTSAYVANMIAYQIDAVAVVSVMASLYSVVTVALAFVFLRERLQWHQWMGIGIVFMGIALVSLP